MNKRHLRAESCSAVTFIRRPAALPNASTIMAMFRRKHVSHTKHIGTETGNGERLYLLLSFMKYFIKIRKFISTV